MLKILLTIFLTVFAFISFSFATERVEYSEAIYGERVIESGSFALDDGIEFIDFGVWACVCGGNPNLFEMSASAHIVLNNGKSVHAAVMAVDGFHDDDDDDSGVGATSCTYWYYTADARYNTGCAQALCYWHWE
jgi:hypothetical protein